MLASGCEVNDVASGIVDDGSAGVIIRLGGALGSGLRTCETGRGDIQVRVDACNESGFDDALTGTRAVSWPVTRGAGDPSTGVPIEEGIGRSH